MKSSFDGTLFRLPIRSIEAAKESKLSKEHYTSVQMRKHLEQFAREAAEMLLFLNFVKHIQVYYRDSPDSPIIRLAEVSIKNSVERHRQLIYQLEQVKQLPKGEPFFDYYQLEIQQTLNGTQSPSLKNWIIARATRLRELNEEEIQYDPTATIQWVGIAASIHPVDRGVFGRVYCCLPLPIETGYPVHINGNFALSSNRR
jgi:sacsin